MVSCCPRFRCFYSSINFPSWLWTRILLIRRANAKITNMENLEKIKQKEKEEVLSEGGLEVESRREAQEAMPVPAPTGQSQPPAGAATDDQNSKQTTAKEQAREIGELDRDNQVKALCDLAFQKGVDLAIETAKALDNSYVLDKLHDTLIDQLKERLIKEDKLEQL